MGNICSVEDITPIKNRYKNSYLQNKHVCVKQPVLIITDLFFLKERKCKKLYII